MENEQTKNGVKSDCGMYSDKQGFQIGKFEISIMDEGERQTVWITDTSIGDGGEFPLKDIEGIIEEYYNKNV